jgi:hypothetical protein
MSARSADYHMTLPDLAIILSLLFSAYAILCRLAAPQLELALSAVRLQAIPTQICCIKSHGFNAFTAHQQ